MDPTSSELPRPSGVPALGSGTHSSSEARLQAVVAHAAEAVVTRMDQA